MIQNFRRIWRSSRRECKELRQEIDELRAVVTALQIRQDLDADLFDAFQEARNSSSYQAVFTDPEPLVSVCIATYNQADLLIQRSVASILNQTWRNFELIVVGDACTDHTAEAMARITDPRVRFYNLPERGRYPDDKLLRWMVAGTVPMNFALAQTRGSLITHLDHDDEHPPDRIAKLVAFLQRERADLVWHPFFHERRPGQWKLNPALRFGLGRVTTSSVLYHHWLKRVPWDLGAYRYHQPGDWNRLAKIQAIGARMARFPEPLLRHFLEGKQRSHDPL